MKLDYQMLTMQLIHKRKIWFMTAICLQFASLSYSQRPNKAETIDFLNKKLGPSCVITAKGGDIITTYSDKAGEKIREDRVAFGYLDTIIKYDPKEQMLYIPTIKGCETCVTRKLYQQKIKKYYSRLAFVFDGNEKEVKSVKKALLHLIRIGSQYRYHNEITLEE